MKTMTMVGFKYSHSPKKNPNVKYVEMPLWLQGGAAQIIRSKAVKRNFSPLLCEREIPQHKNTFLNECIMESLSEKNLVGNLDGNVSF